MTKPQPAPIDAARALELARAVVAHDRFPQLATMIVYYTRPNRVRYMQEWALQYHEVPIE